MGECLSMMHLCIRKRERNKRGGVCLSVCLSMMYLYYETLLDRNMQAGRLAGCGRSGRMRIKRREKRG